MLTQDQHRALEAALTVKLRCMMLEYAHTEVDGIHRSYTNLAVLRDWRITPFALELVIARLKWLQSIL